MRPPIGLYGQPLKIFCVLENLGPSDEDGDCFSVCNSDDGGGNGNGVSYDGNAQHCNDDLVLMITMRKKIIMTLITMLKCTILILTINNMKMIAILLFIRKMMMIMLLVVMTMMMVATTMFMLCR